MSLAWCVARLSAFQPLAPGSPAIVNTSPPVRRAAVTCCQLSLDGRLCWFWSCTISSPLHAVRSGCRGCWFWSCTISSPLHAVRSGCRGCLFWSCTISSPLHSVRSGCRGCLFWSCTISSPLQAAASWFGGTVWCVVAAVRHLGSSFNRSEPVATGPEACSCVGSNCASCGAPAAMALTPCRGRIVCCHRFAASPSRLSASLRRWPPPPGTIGRGSFPRPATCRPLRRARRFFIRA